MKKLIIGVVLVILGLLVGCSGSNGVGDDVATGNIQMEATINGLEEGEEAVLSISFELATTDEAPLLEKNVTGNGEAVTVELDTSLEDGYYQLVLEAPPEYFRDPKGYYFQVWQSEIVNPTGKSIVFDLIPPEAQAFRPYRDSDEEADVSDDGLPYMLEAMISLSAPERNGEPYMPEIEGTMSGLNPDDLWTIDICRADGGNAGCWHGMGGGEWEVGIDIDDDGEGQYYTVTADAEGYSVEPESYKVLVGDEIVYVVEDDEIGEEALHLDFHFSAE
jgi:hypothetical protein